MTPWAACWPSPEAGGRGTPFGGGFCGAMRRIAQQVYSETLQRMRERLRKERMSWREGTAPGECSL